jgi:hypothetical protein
MTRPPKTIANDIAWLAGFLLLSGLIYVGFDKARTSALGEFNSQASRDSWSEWRREAAKSGGPVSRRQPKATEPPVVILMRDMYWTCVVSVWIAAVVLYFSLMAAMRGMLGRPPQIDFQDPVDIAKHRGG